MQIIQNRKKFFILSLLVIIIGFGFMIANAQAGKGALNWDVEFTGGTSMEMDMNGKYDNDKLLSIINHWFFAQYRDSSFQNLHNIFKMTGIRNCQIYDIDFFCIQHCFQICVDFFTTIFLCKFFA